MDSGDIAGMRPPRLTVELVPKPTHFINVRSETTRATWDAISRQVYRAAGYRCEICFGRGEEHPVECHEIWQYDDERWTQKLVGLIALCPMCHRCKHWGKAAQDGFTADCFAHLCRVNGWGAVRAKEYLTAEFARMRARSAHAWLMDLSWLKERKIPVKPRSRGYIFRVSG